LFEVNYQTATRRGLGHFEKGDIITFKVDPEAGAITTLINGRSVEEDKTWNPTVTKGYTCPGVGVEAALTNWRTRLSDDDYRKLCEDTYGAEKAAAREVLGLKSEEKGRPRFPEAYVQKSKIW